MPHLATTLVMDPPPTETTVSVPADKKDSQPSLLETPHIAVMLGAVLLLGIIWVVLVVMLNKLRAQMRDALGNADGVGEYEHKAVMVPVAVGNPDQTLGMVQEALNKEGLTGWRLCTAHTIKRMHFDPASQKPVEVPVMVLWVSRRRLTPPTS